VISPRGGLQKINAGFYNGKYVQKTGNLQWTDKQLAALKGLQAGMVQDNVHKTYAVSQGGITKVSKAMKAGKIPSSVIPATMPSPSATPPGGNTPAAAAY